MDIHERLEDQAKAIKAEIVKEVSISGLATTGIGAYTGLIPPEKKDTEFLKASAGWVYACISVIADELSSIRIRLYKGTKDDDVVEVTDHPALDILQRANSFTTQFDHMWMTIQYLELTGEAPWYVAREKGGVPTSLLLLRPDMLEVVKGTGDRIIDGYEYRVGSKTERLAPEDVVFLRYPDPDKLWRGRGPLQAAAKTVDIEVFSEEYNRKFFYNSARPDGVLSTEQKLGAEQMDRLEKKLAQKHKGIQNAHKTLILEKGVKWEPMGLSQKDMEFLEGSRFSRDKICAIFRVPKNALGLGEDLNRATAEATDYVFIKRTVKPKMERLIQQMNEFLLPLFKGTENMFYDYDNPVPADNLALLEEKKAGLQFGYLTINEVRSLDGYEPIEGGDEVRIPSTNVPVGEEGLMGLSMKPLKGKGKGKKKSYAGRLNLNRAKNRRTKQRAKFKAALEKEIARLLVSKTKAKKAKKKVVKQVEPYDPKALAFQEKQLNIADDYEKKFSSGVGRVFDKQKADVLSRFPKSIKSTKALNWKDYLLLPADQKKLFVAELKRTMSEMLVSQAKEALEFVGTNGDFDSDNPAIRTYLEGQGFRFSTPTTKVTNVLLGRQLRAGISAGEGIPDLRKRVEGVFEGMDRYRSERIARTETIRATNYATLSAYKESGVVQAKQWLTTPDERTCEWCGPMDRRVLGLDDDWFKRGESFQGVNGGTIKLDYGSVDQPPLHPNCRCTLIPIVLQQPSSGAWKPKMTEEAADEFVANSKIRETLYHGTTQNSADSIGDNGFTFKRDATGGQFFDAAYFTYDQDQAAEYAMGAVGEEGRGARPAVLPVKINASKVKTYSWDGLYNEMVSKLGPGFDTNEAREELRKMGLDAIVVNDELNKQKYVAVLDPKSIVVVDKPDYSPN